MGDAGDWFDENITRPTVEAVTSVTQPIEQVITGKKKLDKSDLKRAYLGYTTGGLYTTGERAGLSDQEMIQYGLAGAQVAAGVATANPMMALAGAQTAYGTYGASQAAKAQQEAITNQKRAVAAKQASADRAKAAADKERARQTYAQSQRDRALQERQRQQQGRQTGRQGTIITRGSNTTLGGGGGRTLLGQ